MTTINQTNTIDPKLTEQTCTQSINLNDEDDSHLFAPKIPKQNNTSSNDDDDFFSNLGGSNRPNPSKLVNETKPFENGDNLSDFQQEIKLLNIQKGDDEPTDFIISVSDPRKIGENFMDSFIIFKVRTVVKPESKGSECFKEVKESTVDRRFSDFLGLYEKLKEKYLHKGILVPPPPEKDVKSLAKIKLSQTENQAIELNAISRRRSALERFLNRIAAHPTLYQDDLFFNFLTSPHIQSSKSSTSAFSLSNIKKALKSAEDQVSKLAKPYVEQDAWFDEKNNSVDRVHLQYIQLYGICTQLYRSRREMAQNFLILSQELGGLVQLEKNYDNTGYLSELTLKLGQTYTKLQQLVAIQQQVDCFDLTEILGDHVRSLESVKELMVIRTRAFQSVQNVEETLNNKELNKKRAESEARFDKIPRLEFEIESVKKNVEQAKESFVELSNVIKREISVYEIKRTIRMKDSVKGYLEQLANHHLKMAEVWKEYLTCSRLL